MIPAVSHALAGAVLRAEQTPLPTPAPEHTIYTVTPGISGFIAFFVLAVIGWLLFRSLVKHMRSVDQERMRREAAQPPADDDGPRGTAEPEDAGGPVAGPGR